MLLLLAAVHVTTARAAFPGVSGRIVFLGGGAASDLYSIRADGSALKQLTNGPAIDAAPAWSPNGSRIVLDRQTGTGRSHIYVMNADGGAIRRLTDDRADDFDATWSPDGSRIAFVRGFNPSHIYVMEADGSDQRQVTSGLWPAWSPNGRWLAFARLVKGKDVIFRVHPSGMGRQRVTPFSVWAAYPDWAPTGRKIAFTIVNQISVNSDVATIRPNGEELVRITHDHAGEDVFPAWSPDGTSVVFNRDDGSSSSLYVVDASGAGLPTGLITDGSEPDWQPRCTIVGTKANDVLTGTSRRDVICGRGGNDEIRARRGNDVVFGGPGDDRIYGGTGHDVLVGGLGADHVAGGDGSDLLNVKDGHQGNDGVWGGAGVDRCRRDIGDSAHSCP